VNRNQKNPHPEEARQRRLEGWAASELERGATSGASWFETRAGGALLTMRLYRMRLWLTPRPR
jgi:hypothetical protein